MLPALSGPCLLLLSLLACSGPAPSSSAPTSTPTSAPPIPSGEEQRMTGVVRHRAWSQSTESWEAGGSDYFVLEIGDGGEDSQSVILRETDAVPRARLEALVDQTVTVTGTPAPFVVPDVEPTSNYPMGPDGKPLPRGGGLLVTTITPNP